MPRCITCPIDQVSLFFADAELVDVFELQVQLVRQVAERGVFGRNQFTAPFEHVAVTIA